MLKKILLPTILLILGYTMWISPNFKEIGAGVAIFLFGMLFLEDGFKAFTGGILEKILQKATSSLPKSLGFGVIATTIMQSSSLVSVITISFISAGLITLAAGIGIVFGANLGTTTGAWLVAGLGLKVKISAYAMPMLIFGIILSFQRSRTLKGVGSVLAGLGFLFLGIHYMKEGFETFKDQFDLAQYAVGGYAGLFLFTLIGMVATVVMQSSHATLVLIITALAAGQITYENALALAIGANIGTTITAIIGSMSANIEGKRLAGAHLIFNMVTGLIAIIFINFIAQMVDWVSAHVGIAQDNYTLKLAVFHTIFNLVGVIVMLPFIGKLVTLLTTVFKSKTDLETVEPLYINDASLEFPETVLKSAGNEAWHMYDHALNLMAHSINLERSMILDSKDLKHTIDNDVEIIEFDHDEVYGNGVKKLYGNILDFIGNAAKTIPTIFSEQLFCLRQAIVSMVECVKHTKHLRKNTSEYMVSKNQYMRDEYNHFRYLLASTMRTVHSIRSGHSLEDSLKKLNRHKGELKKFTRKFNIRINNLLAEGKIDNHMASSLLNDLNYIKGFVKRLSKSAKLLITVEMHHASAEYEVETGDEDDFEELEEMSKDGLAPSA